MAGPPYVSPFLCPASVPVTNAQGVQGSAHKGWPPEESVLANSKSLSIQGHSVGKVVAHLVND